MPNRNLRVYESFRSKIKITGNTPAVGNIKDVEIIVSLKYLSNFWIILEMQLINCAITTTCVISNSLGKEDF